MRKRKDLGERKNSMLGKPHEQRKEIKTQARWYCPQAGCLSGTGHPVAKKFML